MPAQFNLLYQIPRLYLAWNTVKAKGSVGGIDGVSMSEFEKEKRKHFYVVTYDIGDDKRRNKVVKLLEGIGTRMNFSVFECMLTDIQYRNLCNQLTKIIIKREDWVNIYPLCTECYARITYIPDIKKKEPVKIVVI